MKERKRKYVKPKEEQKRTTIWLYEDVKKEFDDLADYINGKQYVVDTIGEMIIEGEFDYKDKSDEVKNISKQSVSGNYILFSEVKKAAKELGYKVIELVNDILINDKEDVLKRIKETKTSDIKTVSRLNYLPNDVKNKRTKILLYSDEVIDNFEELVTYIGVRHHVMDIIGRMIIEGEFDYKDKSEIKRFKLSGNYLLYKEVKNKSYRLGYTVTEIFNEILEENNDDVMQRLKKTKKRV